MRSLALPRRLGWLVALGVAFACSSTPPEPAPPVEANVGVFRVRIANDAFDVYAGGKLLLEGMKPSDAFGQGKTTNDADPPMTGFAVRDVTTNFEMLYGSFRWTYEPHGPWRLGKRLVADESGTTTDVLDGAGKRIVTLRVTKGTGTDELVVEATPGDGPERRLSWAFKCSDADRFLGFGAQTNGIDHRGESVPIWVQEQGIKKEATDDFTGAWFLRGRLHSSYWPMPEYLSSRGYFAVAETNHLSTFALCSEQSDVARLQLELPVKLHLFFGPSPKEAIAKKTGRFGRPRVPPAFAFAPWNDAIYDSANVRRVAKKLRDAGAPSSIIWTEDWRGGDEGADARYALREEWEVDRTRYPDFEDVAKELHAAGFKWLVYFNPFVETTSKAWPETEPKGFLIKTADGKSTYEFDDAKFKKASLVDLTNADAFAWAVGKMRAAIQLGADGWMGDYSEWLPTDAQLAGGSGLDLHSGYPVLWQKAQRAAEDGVGDGVERLFFVRSGWFGTPEIADAWWPGDQQSDFLPDDGMPTVVPIGLGVGLAGMSTQGSDIAGYQNIQSTPVDKELFFRWTELGAFSPLMRTHHGSAPKPNWSFESDDETLAHWVRYAKEHVALAPYLRSLAQEAHDGGTAIWRPLAVEFPDDPTTWPIADELMFGDALLVAPVMAAGRTARDVRLPAGTKWFPWRGGPAIDGGVVVSAPAPLAEIPVYARAGSIVPLYPDGIETLTREPSSAKNASSVGGDRVVRVFAGGNATRKDVTGGSYVLTSPAVAPTGPVTATFAGVPLPACGAAPCFDAATSTAVVVGAGTLVLSHGGTEAVKLELQVDPKATTRVEVHE
jgi:alpha-glucosidase